MADDIAVRQHTLDELLTVVGETSGGQEAFSTYFIEKEGKPIPLLYPFRSPHFTILLVTEGRAYLQVNLINYVLHPGELLVIAPAAVQQYKNLSFDCSVSAIGFSRSFLLQAGIHQSHADAVELLALRTEPLARVPPATVSLLHQLLQVLDAKRKETPAGAYNADIIQHTFAAYLLQVAEVFKENGTTEIKHNRKEDLLIQFLQLLPQHFREERSVQYYAEGLFVTPKHLTQTVKELTGRPAGAFIDDMVITEAKILLNNHNLSIAQVADELHFSDQFFFSKYFKKYAGVSPSQYRNGES